MSDMFEWILRKVERRPGYPFYEKSLKRCEGEFSKLKARGLLTMVQPNIVSETYSHGQQAPELVVNLDGKYWPVRDQYSGKDPLDRSDLIKYQFSLETFAEELARANGFTVSPEKLHRRLYYAGDRKIDNKRVALVLALIDQDKTAANLLLGLPGRLPSGFGQYCVVTPSYTIKSPGMQDLLERQQIFVMPLRDFEAFEIDLSLLVKEGTIILSPQEEEECQLYGFIYRVRIRITGERGGKAGNYVLVGENRIRIGDTSFALFLRLVLGLRNNKTGEVPKPDLYEEGYFRKDEDEYQKIDRLRKCFVNIAGIDRLEFIKDQNKCLKISVHPSLIRWDIDPLLNHTDNDILNLVKQLPPSP